MFEWVTPTGQGEANSQPLNVLRHAQIEFQNSEMLIFKTFFSKFFHCFNGHEIFWRSLLCHFHLNLPEFNYEERGRESNTGESIILDISIKAGISIQYAN